MSVGWEANYAIKFCRRDRHQKCYRQTSTAKFRHFSGSELECDFTRELLESTIDSALDTNP